MSLGPIQCMLMRWSIHTLVNLPNCLGMLVSRIAKHAFEILEPLLQEPIDGRTSHDDQTRFICKRTQWHCSCIPAWWLCNLLAPASSFACFACKFHEFVACMSLAKGQTRQARDWNLVSRSKVESVKSINPSNAEQNLSTDCSALNFSSSCGNGLCELGRSLRAKAARAAKADHQCADFLSNINQRRLCAFTQNFLQMAHAFTKPVPQ